MDGIPEILYKYRQWPRHSDVLKKRELFFSSTAKFNDPFEGSIPLRLKKEDFTPDNIFEKYYQMTKKMYPNLPDSQIHEICYQNQAIGLFQDEKHIDSINKQISARLKKEFGVLSLTQRRDSYLMWSHYADSHQGFCIGFDIKILLNAVGTGFQLGKVSYQKELPYYEFLNASISYMIDILNTKGDMWAYEEEYRIVKADFVNKCMQFPEGAVKELIFGVATENHVKSEIFELVKTSFNHTRVFETKLSKNLFETEFLQIY